MTMSRMRNGATRSTDFRPLHVAMTARCMAPILSYSSMVGIYYAALEVRVGCGELFQDRTRRRRGFIKIDIFLS